MYIEKRMYIVLLRIYGKMNYSSFLSFNLSVVGAPVVVVVIVQALWSQVVWAAVVAVRGRSAHR